ncbi:hypothetical protein BCS37_06170 [Selenomonas sp. oral taxon 920]|uniref:hypothetical protein n=1 Tax=Selenomonas sp. oral taxon 920 TaxID=1884263 RepID=UPI000840FA0F|nr:hypothetical protein [Selenomonas sp. oral taxon 920]AOH48044.1 hypothetical protein BCS37_06170 [Selenomonas sp. oral taxon 920]
MAKRGQKIDELYLDIGLNIAQLQLDFDTAGKTVSDSIARLNSKANNIHLKLDADLAKLDGVGTELDKIKVRHQAINRELDIQRQKEQILAAVLQSAKKNDGADSASYRRAESNLLRQQRTVAQTEAEVRKLNNRLKESAVLSGTLGGRIASGMTAAQAGVKNLTSGFNVLSTKMAAVMAVAATGAGLFNITKDAMLAGENVYKLTQRLHVSAGEAATLNRVFQLADTDIKSVIPLIARLDKQVSAAGNSGNDTTRALSRFGIALKDQQGNLLPLNEQLAQLAKGYKTASEAGMEEAYTAEVLGARGAALIPILEQYDDLMTISSRVKTTGLLDPEQAHETYLKWREMEMEAGQLKLALGAALLPAAEELMPEINDGFQTFIETISDNKDEIKDAVLGWGEALKTVAELAGFVGEQIHKVNEHAEANSWLVKNHPVASPLIAIPFLGGTVLDAIYGDEYKQYLEQQKIAKEKAAAEEQARAEAEKNAKAQEQNAKAAQIRAAAEKDAAKTVSESAKATEQLTDSLYTLTHTDIQNSLHALNRESFQFFQKGADPHLIDEYRLAKEAKIYADFQRDVVDKANALYKTDLQNKLDSIAREADAFRQKGLDEVQTQAWLSESKARVMEQWERDVASNIDSIWKTELENRLAEIEREKEAWVQKGLDEVEATRWAEKQKLDAKRNAALEVLRSQKEELQVFKKSGQVGLMEYLRKKNKFTAEDLGLTPELLQQFQSGRKWAMENLLPNFAPEKREDSSRIRVNGQEFSYAQMMAGLGQQAQIVQGGRQNIPSSPNTAQSAPSMTDNRQIHIQVQIENAVTEDNEGMRMLADHVADRIRPAVENALGGDSNSYSHW